MNPGAGWLINLYEAHMSEYRQWKMLTECMGQVPLVEAWLMRRCRGTRAGEEGIGIGDEETFDKLANDPSLKGIL
jgi:hypothetical protein